MNLNDEISKYSRLTIFILKCGINVIANTAPYWHVSWIIQFYMMNIFVKSEKNEMKQYYFNIQRKHYPAKWARFGTATLLPLLVSCTILAQFLLIQVHRFHSYSHSNSFIIIEFICILPPVHGAAVKVRSIVVAPYENGIDFIQRWWQSQICQCFWKTVLQFIRIENIIHFPYWNGFNGNVISTWYGSAATHIFNQIKSINNACAFHLLCAFIWYFWKKV